MNHYIVIVFSFIVLIFSCKSKESKPLLDDGTIYKNNLNSLTNIYTNLSDIVKGKVVKVKDGDTIVILTENNQEVTIRLKSIDAPEKKQPFGQKAKEFVIEKIAGKEVKVIQTSKDRYGRTIGFVIFNDQNLSYELVKNGLAWHYVKYSNDATLQNLENQARNNKIGLWSDKTSISPWKFRKLRKK